MPKRLYSDPTVERKGLAILRILADAREPLGARMVAAELQKYGIELTERAVRYHLRLMDQRGLTRCLGEPGRLITEQGREEIQDALVSDKLGFVAANIEALAYRSTFDVETGAGELAVNISLVPRHRFRECIELMRPVFRAGYCVSELVGIAGAEDALGDIRVPPGSVGICTVSLVTLDALLLRRRIPVEAKYGGIVDIDDREPVRFAELIGYAGSTLDPAEIFITGGMTQVTQASTAGRGRVVASFREAPAAVLPHITRAVAHLKQAGMSGVLAVGRPGQPLLNVPVAPQRVGIAVVGGLNPVAAIAEAGIPISSKAMAGLMDVQRLKSIWSDEILAA